MKYFVFTLIAAFVFLTYYGIVYNVFIDKNKPLELPALRARLGTILWHSTDSRNPNDILENHIYCFYPSGNASYPYKAGEYILKRVEDYIECKDWFGIAIIKENRPNSELQKIWWGKEPILNFRS